MNRPEILAPVGDFAMLSSAINAGCDAIYFGAKILNMRANAKNFEINQIKNVVDICHENKVKAYLTVNTIIYENELKILEELLKKAKEANVDAIIAWDLAVIQKAKELGLEIHLSTQASVSNSEALKGYQKNFGIQRVVLARECSLEQIKEIKKKTKLEIECFIHGAMCLSISGRCFMSQFLFNCSANRGECLQPCRRQYKIVDSEEPDKELLIGPNYALSPKDLCTLPIIDKLIGVIDVFKIEGRNKGPEYVKIVVECYKEAIDLFFEGKLDEPAKQRLIEKAKTAHNRGLSTGFYVGKPMKEWAEIKGSRATKTKKYIGIITKVYKKVNSVDVKIEAGSLKINDNILIIGDKVGVCEQKITSLQIKDGTSVSQANKGDLAGLLIKGDITKIMPKDKVFVF
ncbi:MAG: peptidase U32 family protein [Nanoarchaeota archaeon]